MSDNSYIITRWRRVASNWEGQYAQRPVPGVQPTWTAYAWAYRGLAGYVLTHAAISPEDSMDFPKLGDAQKAAHRLLMERMGAYRRRVASGEGQSLSA